jgi:[ribosomal protein S5]-alanine N-acetyltransferase
MIIGPSTVKSIAGGDATFAIPVYCGTAGLKRRGKPADVLPETIYTSRLLLRCPRPSDAAGIFESYAQDSHVTRYLMWMPHRSVAQTRQFLAESAEGRQAGRQFHWVLCPANDETQVIGMIGLDCEGFKVDLGYALARESWGRGLASEAASAVVDAALAEAHIVRVGAHCHVENLASARVLEKAGMQREGILRRMVAFPNLNGAVCDIIVYAKVKEPN